MIVNIYQVKNEKIEENDEKIVEYLKSNFSMMLLLFTLMKYTFELDKTSEKANGNKIFGGGQRIQ
jgi:hypothetical protein